MFFDTRLWQFTRGVRLRIAAAVAMGVFASLVGSGGSRCSGGCSRASSPGTRSPS